MFRYAIRFVAKSVPGAMERAIRTIFVVKIEYIFFAKRKKIVSKTML